jgi:BirA family biotin operon repressor/biotin-[acetyl-CoA-carboxylase] ligase
MASGKKISGILVERETNSGMLVVGIGLNINMSQHQLKEIKAACGATSMLAETGRHFDPDKVCITLLGKLETLIKLAQTKGIHSIHTLWNVADHLADRLISVQTAEGSFSGKYAGIADDGRLKLLENKTGNVSLFWSGDITIHDEY